MIQTIIFDLGGVLVDWSPLYVYDNYFETEADKNFFFEHICTSDWNEEQDGGRSIQEATELLISQYPEWEQAIRDFYGRWHEMMRGAITETVALLEKIKQSGLYRLYALTNWSAETFPAARERFEFLQWFDGILVSGEEKTRKPFPEFYKKLIDKYQIEINSAIFIDDNLRNVEAAKSLGIHSLHFTSAESLQKELIALNMAI
ncbi:MAG: HAD family phosphatase [Bacteroidetes bacterium]|nr:HAD family phosphatase [Bacteroidota bacterium]